LRSAPPPLGGRHVPDNFPQIPTRHQVSCLLENGIFVAISVSCRAHVCCRLIHSRRAWTSPSTSLVTQRLSRNQKRLRLT
jgi:hypothetical protein